MPCYTLKLLVDLEADDDIEARRKARDLLREMAPVAREAREITLRDVAGRKSIRFNPDGTVQDSWHKA